MKEFISTLNKSILLNLNNNYNRHDDNWFVTHNYYIRNNQKAEYFKDRLIQKSISKYYTSLYSVDNLLTSIIEAREDLKYYEYLFNNLNDEYSKNSLIEVITYRILGPRFFKFKIENDEYNSFHTEINKLKNENDFIDVVSNNWRLNNFNFPFNNKNIACYFTTMGIVTIFKSEQYCYKPKLIEVEDHDVVIDGGGCWGDTALYFANKAKNTHVYTFEFVPSNIELFFKNLALNDNDNIELVERALSDTSGKTHNLIDDGASSYFTDNETDNGIKIQTISIDDFVKEKSISKLDFIKLDIEGAEIDTLRGSAESIRKFKPKLAIAIYHNPIDFFEITHFINELDLGYKFYLDHFTPNIAETILFARIES